MEISHLKHEIPRVFPFQHFYYCSCDGKLAWQQRQRGCGISYTECEVTNIPGFSFAVCDSRNLAEVKDWYSAFHPVILKLSKMRVFPKKRTKHGERVDENRCLSVPHILYYLMRPTMPPLPITLLIRAAAVFARLATIHQAAAAAKPDRHRHSFWRRCIEFDEMGPKIQNWANSLPSGWLSLDQLSMYYESADLQKMALHIRACWRFELKAVWAAPSGLKKMDFLCFSL